MDELLGLEESFRKDVGKQMSDGLTLTGRFEVLHLREGKVIDRRDVQNLVVTAGKAEVAGLINEATSGGFKYIAIGTGTNAAAAGDTALQTEITTNGGQRAIATTLDRVTTTLTNDTARAILLFSFTGSFAVTEAGLLDAVSGGILLARQVFSVVNVATGESLQITWQIKVA